ncbi:MATE family efflux transporter [Parendozoicomonas haliclonae]|uniref:Multidrug-efflux transporter n=1 Tax=Parendozoicomonas haliclonae TaxID=1960125 RepID=A0A1X7AKF6_9GAMM|nr:MATE family efflux transporter [Parendozoicomonas haliclonae]SMA47854.1 Multidrug resistance protein NorM [Parendozoicomonas haliclonae]
MQQLDIGRLNSPPASRRLRLQMIARLALPITGGMLSQSLINLVDTAMIGRLGEVQLAAVATANYAIFVCFALISGLSVAVQSSVARDCGAGRRNKLLDPVGKGIRLAFVAGIPITILLVLFSPYLVRLFDISPEVADYAAEYFQLRIISLPAGMMLLTYRGFWNGCRHPMSYLKILVGVHIINALLSYQLIFGIGNFAGIGLAGAAAGTVIAMYCGVLANTLQVKRFSNHHDLHLKTPGTTHSKPLIRKAWPDSAQQTLFALGTALLFWLIAWISSEAMAISHILVNISLLLILPGIGLGMAATTLINQALGANQTEQAFRWGLEVVMVAVIVLTILSLPLIVFPELVLSLFLPSTSPLIEQARLPLQLVGIGMIVDSAALVLTQALLGTGSNKTVMILRISTLWLIGLPLTALAVGGFQYGLIAVWIIQVGQRALASLACLVIWYNRRWIQQAGGSRE